MPGYSAYLNLDEGITMDSIVNSKSNLKFSQDSLGRIYLNHKCDTLNIKNALVYQILSKMFMETDAHVSVTQGGQAAFFNVHKQLFGQCTDDIEL